MTGMRRQGVVAALSQRYATTVADLLHSLRRTEASMKRIKRGRASEVGAGGDGGSEIDKMALQLLLDIQARHLWI